MRDARRLFVVALCGVVFVGALIGLVATLSASSRDRPAEPRLSVKTYVVPEFMTAVYKAYSGGDPDRWLARTVVTNTGDTPVRDLRIEYAVSGYVASTSVGEYPVVLPGQTVRDYCYPVFDGEQMAAIESETPAELLVTYECDGMDRPVTASERFDFLGHNEWVRTGLPEEQCLTFQDWHDNDEFLAVFVTHKDPATQALAKQLTGGVFTATDDGVEDALSGIYYGLRDAPFRYVTEAESYWTDGFAQHVQLPRETIAYRSGNCVDLSVLFAALLEAVGVKTYVTLSTGHCQVCVELPERGTIVPIEATMVDDSESTLQDAYDAGFAWYEEQSAQGTYIFVDVEDAWSEGMVPTW
jgi:transglutaminase-like putative cysteine protease